jgi:poly(3-hydroxybutyrate) depolymerase
METLMLFAKTKLCAIAFAAFAILFGCFLSEANAGMVTRVGAHSHGCQPCHTSQTARKIFLAPGDHRVATRVQGMTREYEIHIPKGYKGSEPLDVFLVLPGVAESIDSVKDSTHMNSEADAKHVAAVYVQPLPKILGLSAWNLMHGAMTTVSGTYDDLTYISQVKREVAHNIHVHKWFIVGHSEGGAAAQYVVEKMPGVFSGLAGVKSTRLTSDPAPHGRLPQRVLFVVGGNDNILLPQGGSINPFMLIAAPGIAQSRPLDQAKAYGKAMHCKLEGRSRDQNFQVTTKYRCEGGGKVVQVYRPSAQHDWNDAAYNTTRGILDFMLAPVRPLKQ